MSRSVPILMYHLVSPEDPERYAPYQDVYRGNAVNPAAFEAQMGWLARRGFQAVSLNDVMDSRTHGAPLPRRPVVITFDDGYQETADYAVPVLQRHGFTAHFFLVSGMVGRTAEWDTATYGWEFPLFDWECARKLQAEGFHCDAHSLTHRRMGDLSSRELHREVDECQRMLAEELGRESRHFAYPHGSHNAETKDVLREAGFRSACSVKEGLSLAGDDPYALSRVWVTADDSLSDFRWAVRTGAPPKRWPRAIARRARNRLRRSLRRSASGDGLGLR